MKNVLLAVWLILSIAADTVAENKGAETPVTVGVATILSGDFTVLGNNIMRTCETYKKHYLRHPLRFLYEDAKLGSLDGLHAYEKLIAMDSVDMLIGGTSSNGTLAAKEIINNSKTPMITPLTGGRNVDVAGPYIFRIGNSDILNGYGQAEYFIEHGITKVALFVEETEYTQDIATSFRERFLSKGGKIVYDSNFLPGQTDFRTEVSLITAKKPQAVFIPTQTGVALGLFLKQLREREEVPSSSVHTSFVAAANPDAGRIAGVAINGVRYMAPKYDKDNSALLEFFNRYRADHGQDPDIPFHTAGTVDALNMLQDYLDSHQPYDREGFASYLLKAVKNYHGLMGVYSFDTEGNANTTFVPAEIKPGG